MAEAFRQNNKSQVRFFKPNTLAPIYHTTPNTQALPVPNFQNRI
jgi:hypothetical protein